MQTLLRSSTRLQPPTRAFNRIHSPTPSRFASSSPRSPVHPLASNSARVGSGYGRTGSPTSTSPLASRASKQRVTALTAVLAATLTGTICYLIGLKTNAPNQTPRGDGHPALSYREPTRKDFDSALKELRSNGLPDDCIAVDRDSIIARAHSDWACK